MNKRILQTILALIALVAIVTGMWSIISGVADKSNEISINTNNSAHIIFDSNYRYYSGLWLGVGFALLWIIPTIEKQKSAFRLISCIIFIGGIGRIVSMLTLAPPHPLFIFFTVIELLFPLLILMQNRISAS